MRVEIYDQVMRNHTIGSKNPRLIGEWFAEHAALIMSADARDMAQIRIWPEDEEEMEMFRNGHRNPLRFKQDDLLFLAEQILDYSKKLADVTP